MPGHYGMGGLPHGRRLPGLLLSKYLTLLMK